jgi:hypothetical protein
VNFSVLSVVYVVGENMFAGFGEISEIFRRLWPTCCKIFPPLYSRTIACESIPPRSY